MGPKALFLTTVIIIKSETDQYHFSFEYRISITSFVISHCHVIN